MAKHPRKRKHETFHSEAPLTVWPPTLTRSPTAFVRRLSRIWGRGISILVGALLLGLGFFVLGGGLGSLLGGIGALMIVGALVWDRFN